MSNDVVIEGFSFNRLEYNKRDRLLGLGSEIFKGKFITESFPNGREVSIMKFTAPERKSCKNNCRAPNCIDECKDALYRYFQERKRDLELLKTPQRLHENFIRYETHIVEKDSIYIATELCQWSVADLVKKEEQFDKSEDYATVKAIREQLGVVEILRQSTEGLSFLHGFGYIHRNLDPANFWVAKYEHSGNTIFYQIKISNFRYSKNINVNPDNSCTIAEKWFAPECAVKGNVDEGKILALSADVFVLGMYYFYVLFGGRHPFEEEGDDHLDAKTYTESICWRMQKADHKIYNWTTTNDDGYATFNSFPWDHEKLIDLYGSIWRIPAVDDYYERVDVIQTVIHQALSLIKGMMKYKRASAADAGRLTLKQVSENNFFKSKAEKRYIIDVPGQKLGLCLIFCNSSFDDEPRLATLKGWENDRDRLSETFKNLGFDVQIYNNLTAEKIEMTVRRISKTVDLLKSCNCLVVCFLSHGSSEGIYGKDGHPVSVHKMQYSFNSIDCPAMHDKPKIFLFNACRVFDETGGLSTYSSELNRESLERPYLTINPNMSPVNDMISIMATTKGTRAATLPKRVSYFTEFLCAALAKQENDLDEILYDVQRKMQLVKIVFSGEKEEFIQTPERISSLRNRIFLTNKSNLPLT